MSRNDVFFADFPPGAKSLGPEDPKRERENPNFFTSGMFRDVLSGVLGADVLVDRAFPVAAASDVGVSSPVTDTTVAFAKPSGPPVLALDDVEICDDPDVLRFAVFAPDVDATVGGCNSVRSS